MVEHKEIQNPDRYSETDYHNFEVKLFNPETSTKELEEICMTLAHLPTKRAQELLSKFKESDRATEVIWLDCAIDECKFHYLCSDNEEEELDLIALKLAKKKNDNIIELMGKQSKFEFRIQECEIELRGLQSLKKSKLTKAELDDIGIRISAMDSLIATWSHKLEKVVFDIAMEEKIVDAIMNNIKTEKYKGLNPWDVESIHFDGEEW